MNDSEIRKVNIGLVKRPNPPVRDHFDEPELERLTSSIRENGVLVPLMVVRRGDEFEVVDGDRRLQACWAAGLREIPVVVHALDDSQIHVQRMLANLDRHDPDPVSEAKYIAQLVSAGAFTAEQFAEKLGRTLDWVAGRLEIAQMPEYMQTALSEKRLTLGVAMELYLIQEENTRRRYFDEAIRHGMTVSAAHIVRLQINEAIEGLEAQGQEVNEETLPMVSRVPEVECALTGERMPINETRMVRVGVRNYERWRNEVRDMNREAAPVS